MTQDILFSARHARDLEVGSSRSFSAGATFVGLVILARVYPRCRSGRSPCIRAYMVFGESDLPLIMNQALYLSVHLTSRWSEWYSLFRMWEILGWNFHLDTGYWGFIVFFSPSRECMEEMRRGRERFLCKHEGLEECHGLFLFTF
jgi:hypothetical protein